MKFLKGLVIFIGIGFLACESIAPTPILSRKSVDLNQNVVEMVLACSDGPNYTPEAEGCDPQALKEQSQVLMVLAEKFISADNIQAQSFDIYLHAVMIYFRVTAVDSVEQVADYGKAERVARQFFRTEEAYKGSSINKSRFWWVYFTTSNVGLRARLFIFKPDEDRLQEIGRVIHEGENALVRPEGLSIEWVIKLEQDLVNLKVVKTFAR
jgi:hypothetical protein